MVSAPGPPRRTAHQEDSRRVKMKRQIFTLLMALVLATATGVLAQTGGSRGTTGSGTTRSATTGTGGTRTRGTTGPTPPGPGASGTATTGTTTGTTGTTGTMDNTNPGTTNPQTNPTL